MTFRMLRQALFAVGVCVAIMFVGARRSLAADLTEDDSWRTERDQLKATADARVKAEVNKRMDKRAMAKAWRLSWPVTQPKQKLADVRDEVNAMIAGLVDTEYPDKEAQFRKAAEKTYRVYDRGEKVEPFFIRKRKGPHAHVKGRFVRASALRVHVGNRWIHHTDMSEEVLARFDPQLSKLKIAEEVASELRKYALKRENYRQEQEKRLVPEAYVRAGYFWKWDKHRSDPDPKYWISKADLLDLVYADRRAKLQEDIREDIEREVLGGSGYLYDDVDKEWMPEDVYKAVAADRREEEERKKKEDEDKKKREVGAGMGGESGMGGGTGLPGDATMGMGGGEANMGMEGNMGGGGGGGGEGGGEGGGAGGGGEGNPFF